MRKEKEEKGAGATHALERSPSRTRSDYSTFFRFESERNLRESWRNARGAEGLTW